MKNSFQINFFHISLILLLLPSFAFSQKVKGYIYDVNNNEELVGVNVYYTEGEKVIGTTSDVNGYYELELQPGSVRVTYSFLGFETKVLPLVVVRDQILTMNVEMHPQYNIMDEVVVSAGRYEQKMSEVTVSMEVLKAQEITRQNPTDLSVLLKNVSGVDIIDKQPSIRGGGGWTYGVGSRSLILVDGMSVLSPGVGEINWNVVPLENVDQIEVLKGASSVLYGSSALNGLINVRTARPSVEPKTRVNTYMGVYGNPANKNNIWWDKGFWNDGKTPVNAMLRKEIFYGIKNPMYNGLDISHSRRIGNIDVSAGINLYSDEGYRESNYDKHLRAGGNLTYHDKKVDGLNYGFNTNLLTNRYSGFFIWRSADEPLMQSPLTNMGREEILFYFDPFLNYYNKEKNTSHRVKGRFFYKSAQILSNPTNKTLAEIASKMNFDYNSIPEIIQIVQDPEGEIMNEILPIILQGGNIGDVAEYFTNLGNQWFPDATAPDYVDLISWVMGRMPFPSDTSEIIPWLLNSSTPNKNNTPADHTKSYFLDYQFNKKYKNSAFTTGITFDHVSTDSEMTGYHESDNIAAYFQYDVKLIEKLNLSAGVRLEYYRVDSLYKEAETNVFGLNVPFKPVLRGGLNYELAEHSFLRASFGQGYRYPSITEKFVYKDIGGIAAYPNSDLKPEMGYNAELGFKQGYKIGRFMGYVDLAAFYTYYRDMIEFQFGLFNNSNYEYVESLSEVITMLMNGQTPGLGIRFQNVDKTQIYGIDLSVNGLYNISPELKLNYNLGYVYTEPEDMGYKDRNKIEEANTDPLAIKSKSNTSKYLKYRQKHTLKAALDLQWRRLNLGTNLTWKSKTLAVDYFMVDEREKDAPDAMDFVRSLIFSGLHDYWTENNNGYFTMDLRLGVKVTESVQFQFHINNLLNEEYCIRPMDIAAPRTFVFQAVANF